MEYSQSSPPPPNTVPGGRCRDGPLGTRTHKAELVWRKQQWSFRGGLSQSCAARWRHIQASGSSPAQLLRNSDPMVGAARATAPTRYRMLRRSGQGRDGPGVRHGTISACILAWSHHYRSWPPRPFPTNVEPCQVRVTNGHGNMVRLSRWKLARVESKAVQQGALVRKTPLTEGASHSWHESSS
ncbi:uncharacterized protein B0I36DRAFT_143751 [Microdochium trichocladiopsis]|uniref:Uncharacterized protein n=1 Tax=Microdochium trichocladiopsis TaxID=1682393 RepID=A0A9P8Y3H1_9PEZI|nr:uncharacterized protein B0I36DRAFT_143751 [Microdochium trichocladiopsis]KAH7027809.1 hypothetical protein B0I36DRAFT_143751 [Microdochium trichocladiopsis]